MAPADNYKHVNSKGITYFLNGKDITLKNGRVQRIYFFSKDERKTKTYLPDGYEAFETKHTLPILRKVQKVSN